MNQPVEEVVLTEAEEAQIRSCVVPWVQKLSIPEAIAFNSLWNRSVIEDFQRLKGRGE